MLVGALLAILEITHLISLKQALLYFGIYFAGVVVGYYDKRYIDSLKPSHK